MESRDSSRTDVSEKVTGKGKCSILKGTPSIPMKICSVLSTWVLPGVDWRVLRNISLGTVQVSKHYTVVFKGAYLHFRFELASQLLDSFSELNVVLVACNMNGDAVGVHNRIDQYIVQEPVKIMSTRLTTNVVRWQLTERFDGFEGSQHRSQRLRRQCWASSCEFVRAVCHDQGNQPNWSSCWPTIIAQS